MKKIISAGKISKLLFLSSFLFISFIQGNNCPDEGQTKSGKEPSAKIKALNMLKNRKEIPAAENINRSITLDKMLNSGDDADYFSNNDAAFITGYIFRAKDEEGESCNCYSSLKTDHDIHVYISPYLNTTSIGQCAVVEITPFSKTINAVWTSNYINSLKGKRVTIKGWMMYDFEHLNASYDHKPDAEYIERRTVWEIHPVTGISVDD